jgi:uncharacterized protein (TIGR00369 family)
MNEGVIADQIPEDESMLAALQRRQPPFSRKVGIHFVEATPDRVIAEMQVEADMCNNMKSLHGGAMMSLADTAGAMSTAVTLTEGQGTTTIESKSNFFAPVALGDVAVAEAIPLHKGRTTYVWETRITRKSDGRLAALITQTQLILN